jgi:hypothetical protein
VIYITTDHGRDSSGYNHGGQTARERTTWIVTNENNLNERFRKQPAIVDIMPSLAGFLDIRIPDQQLWEIDGISFTGKISATDARAQMTGEWIQVKWKPVHKEGKARIWIATGNDFKTGGRDDYKMMKEVPVANGAARISVAQMPSDFYKVVIQLPYNDLNRWIVKKEN